MFDCPAYLSARRSVISTPVSFFFSFLFVALFISGQLQITSLCWFPLFTSSLSLSHSHRWIIYLNRNIVGISFHNKFVVKRQCWIDDANRHRRQQQQFSNRKGTIVHFQMMFRLVAYALYMPHASWLHCLDIPFMLCWLLFVFPPFFSFDIPGRERRGGVEAMLELERYGTYDYNVNWCLGLFVWYCVATPHTHTHFIVETETEQYKYFRVLLLSKNLLALLLRRFTIVCMYKCTSLQLNMCAQPLPVAIADDSSQTDGKHELRQAMVAMLLPSIRTNTPTYHFIQQQWRWR